MNYNDSNKKLNSSYDNLDSLRINRSTHNRSILQTDKGLSRSLMIVPSDDLYQVDLLIKKKRIMIQLLRQGLSAEDAEYYVTQLELEDIIDMSVPALTQQVFSNQIKSSFEFENHRDPSRIRKQDCCGICMDQLSEPIIKLQCHHEFCEQCFNQACLDRIMTGSADRIICPEDGCQQIISDQTILDQLGQETYAKMMRFRLIKQMANNPRLKQCPRPGCELIFEVINKYICECGQRICEHCDQAYHPGISCEAQVDDQFNQMKKKMQIQECPKCSAPIQKNKGCNHMTCKVCSYQFCWLCRDRYTYKHYDAYNIFGCPGLQYKDWEPFTCPSFYRFLYILAILIVIGPAGAIALVLLIILGPSILTYIICECLQVERNKEVICMIILVNVLFALSVTFTVLLIIYHEDLANYWMENLISSY